MSPEPLLVVDGVQKRFRGLRALDGVSIEVARRSITGLIGPNGAGKTTPFDVITGLLPPDAGEILLGPHRLDRRPPHAIARLGVARTFEIPRPLTRLTVLENVLLYAKDQAGLRPPGSQRVPRAERAKNLTIGGWASPSRQTRAEGQGRALLEDPEIRRAYLGG